MMVEDLSHQYLGELMIDNGTQFIINLYYNFEFYGEILI